MPQPGTILDQITEEFEQLGGKIVKETVQAPKDIAGKALESLGTSSGKQQKSSTQTVIKNATARAALEELAGRKPKPKEPSVRERLEMEVSQKKEMEAKKAEVAKKAQLPVMTQKPAKGNLYGIGIKQSIEKNRNVRQD
jgi:phytoene dehydrogenase-like protein